MNTATHGKTGWTVFMLIAISLMCVAAVIAVTKNTHILSVDHMTCWAGEIIIYEADVVATVTGDETLLAGPVPTITGNAACKRELIGHRKVEKHNAIRKAREEKEEEKPSSPTATE